MSDALNYLVAVRGDAASPGFVRITADRTAPRPGPMGAAAARAATTGEDGGPSTVRHDWIPGSAAPELRRGHDR